LTYRVTLTRAALRDLVSLPRDVLARVDRVLLGLGAEPRPAGVKKLSGSEDLYRVRVGAYR
jgi:mRNA interferase RelE/StbE